MKNNNTLTPKSSISGIDWPALPGPAAAAMLAMQYQLEQSQWWPEEVMLEHQFRQLNKLLVHAYETVPYYQKKFRDAGFDPEKLTDPKSFRQLPLLRRNDIQLHSDDLLSRQVPPDHGKVSEVRTSGSTGAPIRTFSTDITQFFWKSFTLRDHLWHRRDLTARLAAIRTDVKDGSIQGWGPSTDIAFNTGPCAMLHIKADTDTQSEWLKEHNPDYLISFPSNLHALAKRCIAKHITIPNLREVRTFGEALSPDLRPICKEAWGVNVVDMYSSQEAGYIALQCPHHEHYHIQSENVIVELLNGDDRPCVPGEIGRIVLTTLNNFASPLIRYEIMDYAEAGGPCDCGRKLPVLKHILGRQRNMLTMPDGKQKWPSFAASEWASIGEIRQIQIVQRETDLLIVRLVSDSPLSAEQESRFTEMIQRNFGWPFRLAFEYHKQLERKANYKYEDFISELA